MSYLFLFSSRQNTPVITQKEEDVETGGSMALFRKEIRNHLGFTYRDPLAGQNISRSSSFIKSPVRSCCWEQDFLRAALWWPH